MSGYIAKDFGPGATISCAKDGAATVTFNPPPQKAYRWHSFGPHAPRRKRSMLWSDTTTMKAREWVRKRGGGEWREVTDIIVSDPNHVLSFGTIDR